MVVERRKATRFEVFESGSVVFQHEAPRCIIQNLSLTGAKLQMLAGTPDLPSDFLLVRGSTQLLHCRMVWSGERTAGVIFTRPLRQLAG